MGCWGTFSYPAHTQSGGRGTFPVGGGVDLAELKPTNNPLGGRGVGVAVSELTDVRPNRRPEQPLTNMLANPESDTEIAAVQLVLHRSDAVPGTGQV